MSLSSDPAVIAGSVRSTVVVEQIVGGSVIIKFKGPGCSLMITPAEGGEVQFSVLVTVKVYVPGSSPVTVTDVPEPGITIPPGDLVSLHSYDEGKPVSKTLPVATE